MADRELPTVEQLRQLISYDPATGELTWRVRPPSMFLEGSRGREAVCKAWNKKYAGKPALRAIGSHGYMGSRIMGVSVLAHRVAYALHSGGWPMGEVDHVNGDRLDNRACNLRLVDSSGNKKNSCLRKDNVSGITGVNWQARDKKWAATITSGGKRLSLGYYSEIDDAIAARRSAERRLGFSDRHGKVLG